MPIGRDAMRESTEDVHTHSDAAMHQHNQAGASGGMMTGRGRDPTPASQESTPPSTRAASREWINDLATRGPWGESGNQSRRKQDNPLVSNGSRAELQRTRGGDSRDQGGNQERTRGDSRDQGGNQERTRGDSRDQGGNQERTRADSRDQGGNQESTRWDSRDQGGNQESPFGSTKGSRTEVRGTRGDDRRGVSSTSSTLEWVEGTPSNGLPLIGPIMDTKI